MAKPSSSRPAPARLFSARTVAVDLLEQVLDQRQLLDDALDNCREWSRLELRDRGWARQMVATTLRRRGQIDDLIRRCLDRRLPTKAMRVRHILRLGAAQLLFLDTPPHAVLATAVDMVKGTGLAGFAGLINAVLRRLDREGRAWVTAQDAARLNTPDWLWESWCAAYGETTTRAIALAHLREAPLDLTLTRADTAALWAPQLDATVLPTGSLRRAAVSEVSSLPGYAQGAWWVQDAAAALPARMLGVRAGQTVADLCAAPGGKTLQMLAAGADVTAVDRSAKRLKKVQDNAARLGRAVTTVAADLAAWQPEQLFDAVLLDAPCSATGTLRRHPDGLWLKKPGDVAALVAQQALFLRQALSMVRPGGTLVYCVCSLQPEEGEEQIAHLLSETTTVRRKPVTAADVGDQTLLLTNDGDVRTLPCFWEENGGMDGFFAARLERI